MRPQKGRLWRFVLLFTRVAARAVRFTAVGFCLGSLVLGSFGFLLAAWFALHQFEEELARQIASFDQMTVYVSGGLPEKTVSMLISRLAGQPLVRGVKRQPSKVYLSRLSKRLGLETKPFKEVPADLVPRVITLDLGLRGRADQSALKRLMRHAASQEGVLAVYFEGEDWLTLLDVVIPATKVVQILAIVCLFAAASLVYFNGVMVASASQEEFCVMRLAGAGSAVAAAPFLVYAFLQWLVGVGVMVLAAKVMLLGLGGQAGYAVASKPFVEPWVGLLWSGIACGVLEVGMVFAAFRAKLGRLDPFCR